MSALTVTETCEPSSSWAQPATSPDIIPKAARAATALRWLIFTACTLTVRHRVSNATLRQSRAARLACTAYDACARQQPEPGSLHEDGDREGVAQAQVVLLGPGQQ